MHTVFWCATISACKEKFAFVGFGMDILMIVFAVFALLGAADRIFGNRLGIGKEFEKGIVSAGTLSLSMVGMICIAPVISKFIVPLITPAANYFNFDPSVIIGCLLANDLGGASLAGEIAKDELLGGFNGLVVSSMLGVTVSFTVPVALGTIKKELHKEVLLGILCGIAVIPVGCVVSGFILGIPFKTLMLDLAPVTVVAIITCLGIAKAPKISVKIFKVLGYLITCLVTVGLAGGIFKALTGKELIHGMTDISQGFSTVANIAVILAGVFPFLFVLSKLLGKVFAHLGRMLGINETSVMGFVSSLANSIPTFENVEKMDKKGIVMNMAFAVSGSFVFGDHLAFTMAFDKSFSFAVTVGKLVSAFSAVIVSVLVYKANYSKEEKVKTK